MKKKAKLLRPDDSFSLGPLSMARFGKNVVIQSDWSEDSHHKMQQRAVAEYPNVVREIDQLVGEIAKLVKELPAEQLLHRAWWEMVGKSIKIKSESEMDANDAVSIRMIDYVQSMIAAVEPAANPREEVTEKEWQTLTINVGKLFQTINSNFQICLRETLI
jgi:hypothetical protein